MRGAPHSGLSWLILDQIADVGRDRGPADTTARLPTPVQTEAAPMPAHQRLRLEDNRALAHGRTQPIEPDEDQAICRVQPEPRWRRPLQDDKLLAEKCRFGLASRVRSEQSDEQSAEQLQEVKHRKARIAHRGIRAIPDTIFGSHNGPDRPQPSRYVWVANDTSTGVDKAAAAR